MITHKLTLDVARDGIQGNIVLVKGERASRDIAITLRNGKNAVELGEGYLAALRGIKPDGTELFNSCVVYTENGVYPNTVVYHVTGQTVAVEGNFTIRLLIWDNEGAILWSPEFSVTVKENGSLDSNVGSQSEFTALIDAAVQAQNAAKDAENNAEKTNTTADELKEDVQSWLKERDGGLSAHTSDKENPHGVTAEQLGLERVDNTCDEEKPLSLAARVALETIGQELTDKEVALIARVAQALADAKVYADETKVGKRGVQVIDGSLTVSGNFYVGGQSFAKDMESLEVADAVIIANSDGVPLSELSGYVIRVNGDSAYAIVYDPADDCVKIGLGVYDSNTKVFTFTEGEAQVLATRGSIEHWHVPVWDNEEKTFRDSGVEAGEVTAHENIKNGNIPEWDAEKRKLVDSGKSASDFATKDAAQFVAPALKGSASGEIVAMKDISPLEHNLGVKVSSKNSIPYPFEGKKVSESNGITWTYNDDGTIGVKGIATEYAMVHLIGKGNDDNSLSPYLEDGKTYTLSIQAMNGETVVPSVLIAVTEIATGTKTYFNITNPTFTVDKSRYTYEYLRVYIGGTLIGKEFDCVVGVQFEKGTTATAYTPYVADIEAVRVMAQGKNLFNSDKSLISLYKIQRVEGGDFTEQYGYQINLSAGTYTVSSIKKADSTSGLYLYGVITDKNGNLKQKADINQSTNVYPPFSITLSEGDILYFYDAITRTSVESSYSTFDAFEVQIELGTTATEYEPYKSPVEYTVNADGTVDGVKSISPSTTLTTDTEGVLIECEYNRDINKAFAELQQAIISLGGNV